MKSCGGCSTWIPDDAAFCPSCGRAQGGSAPPPGTPPVPPTEPGPGPTPGPGFPAGGRNLRGRTEMVIRRLGLLYMVVGGMVLLNDFASFYAFASGSALRSLKTLAERFPPDIGKMMLDIWQRPAVLAVAHVVPFAFGVLLVYAGSELRNLRGRTPALVAAVLGVVFFIAARDCCCLSVPLAIYALVVLTRPDVEAALRK